MEQLEILALPAPRQTYINPTDINIKAIPVTTRGLNPPDITPSSKITIPSTTAKLKPYKEPNYRTRLPSKKSIKKPK